MQSKLNEKYNLNSYKPIQHPGTFRWKWRGKFMGPDDNIPFNLHSGPPHKVKKMNA